MPLKLTTETPDELATWLKSTATTTKPSFAIVYSSLTDGKMWCGDCREAEPFIDAKFAGGEQEVTVVYVGQRDEWKNRPDNIWRQEPFFVTGVPTLIKATGDGVFEHLQDPELFDAKKIDTFVDGVKPAL